MSKSLFKSKTIWGIAAMGLSQNNPALLHDVGVFLVNLLGSGLGIQFSPEQQAAILAKVMLYGGGLLAAYGRMNADGPLHMPRVALKPPAAAALAICCLPWLGGCATFTGTTDPAQQILVIDQDVTDGVRLAAVAEISHDPNSRQYFVLASEALNTLTANGTPTLTQINAELAKVVPAKYQDIVSSVTQIAADKYQQWYNANSGKLTSGQTGQYIVGVIKAARDGIDRALASTVPPA